MSGDILTLLGGTGMFLLGMRMMTGALGELASRQTRAVLRRVTTSPLTGAVAGAATTALIQSSSATLVMTIGFVGAGLLSFPQAMGVVFGANVGTTITGWMVVLLGFKLDLARLALPLLFAAGLLLALGRGSWGRVGGLLAGFSLVFLGLDMMQAGAEGFRDGLLTFAPTAETLWGRLRLLLLGVAVTVVIQSSSAGVAAIVAPMQYSQILWATAYGYLLFDEAPDRATILGAGVIIASGLYIVFRETRAGASAHRPVIEARGRTETATTPKSSVLQRLFSGRGNGVS